MSLPKKETLRIAYLDILKILSIFAVLIIHASVEGFYYPPFSVKYVFTVMLSCLSRFAVPVFVMCSGAVFLSKEREFTIKQIFFKYIFRIVVVLIVTSVFYECVTILEVYFKTGVFDLFLIKRGIYNLLSFNTHFHLYYLYIMVLVYAFVPLIRTFLKASDKSTDFYLLVFLFVTANLLPTLRFFFPFDRYFGGITTQFSQNLSYGMISYFFLGYFLNTYTLTKKQTSLVVLLGILGGVATFLLTTINTIKTGVLCEFFLNSTAVNVYFMAAGLFAFIKSAFKKPLKDKTLNVLSLLSKSTFVTYLIHPFFNIIFKNLGLSLSAFSPLLSLPVMVLINFVLCFFVYLVLSKIPLIKKFI